MAVHFVGFRGDEYTSAVPDFIHRVWDFRARDGGEYDPTIDILVFARGEATDEPTIWSFNDSDAM